jgi:hypothetical protein
MIPASPWRSGEQFPQYERVILVIENNAAARKTTAGCPRLRQPEVDIGIKKALRAAAARKALDQIAAENAQRKKTRPGKGALLYPGAG